MSSPCNALTILSKKIFCNRAVKATNSRIDHISKSPRPIDDHPRNLDLPACCHSRTLASYGPTQREGLRTARLLFLRTHPRRCTMKNIIVIRIVQSSRNSLNTSYPILWTVQYKRKLDPIIVFVVMELIQTMTRGIPSIKLHAAIHFSTVSAKKLKS